jgi:hypothetical protein
MCVYECHTYYIESTDHGRDQNLQDSLICIIIKIYGSKEESGKEDNKEESRKEEDSKEVSKACLVTNLSSAEFTLEEKCPLPRTFFFCL